MAHRKSLTEEQVVLLRWIAHGCPDGRYEGTHHRISAAALRSRGLVTTQGHGPTWTAQITEAGVSYLSQTDGSAPPAPRQANTSVAAQLVDDVMQAGGSLRLPRSRWNSNTPDFERRADIANSRGKVPDGKKLVVTRVSSDQIQVDLVDGPRRAQAQPLQVPDTVGRLHHLVREFRDDKSRHGVRRETLPRTLRVPHTLISEAEAQGIAVASTTPGGRRKHPSWSGPRDGHFTFTLEESTVSVRVTEVGLGSRANWEHTTSSWWYRQNNPKANISDYEAKGTGNLKLEMLTYNRGPSRQARWSDGRRGTVESCLGELILEIKQRAADRDGRRRVAIAEHEQKVAAWMAAVATAQERAFDAMRAEALSTQAQHWVTAQQIRSYCDAMAAQHGNTVETLEWIDWAHRHADEIDPLRSPPRGPDLPKPLSPSELRPFLGRHHPYRPPKLHFVD